MSRRHKTLSYRIAQALKEEFQRNALQTAVIRGREGRNQAVSQLPDGEAFRQEVRKIKEACIENLDDLLKEFSKNAERRGAKVYFAKDGEEACQYILELAQAKGVKRIIKSKSLTSEEIELNEPLERAGLEVVETDLGERIIQLAREKPYHLVFPAVHKTAAQVAQLFSHDSGREVQTEMSAIMQEVRRSLRPIFLNADMGITGANVAIAETGTIIIETNEGNGRLVSSVPPVHVCIMGVEKIVSTIEEALKMIQAHPVSAVGQMLTTYVSFISGRSPLGDQTGREMHIVILDNGRSEMRRDEWFREALYCIRCGACMNICPTYGVLGGHLFGFIYPGPIGIPWTARTHGLDRAAQFVDLCISCGLCKEICPAEIDMPLMIARVKNEILSKESQPFINKILMANEIFASLASKTAPVSNWLLKNPIVKILMEKIPGIERRRKIPAFHRRTFKKIFLEINQSLGAQPRGKVVYFVDYYFNYHAPHLAVKAVQLLNSAQIEVALPEQRSSGYPFFAYGELDKMTKVAAFNFKKLEPYVRRGYDVLTPEPTAAYALKFVYPRLIPEAQLLADKTFELMEYLYKLHSQGLINLKATRSDLKRLGFHIPCHERGCSAGQGCLKLLTDLGYEVEVIETGTCCGMAGTFGMKHGPLGYELSMAVGEPLFEKFNASGVEAIVTESSVCRMQLEDGTGLKVWHPLELVGGV